MKYRLYYDNRCVEQCDCIEVAGTSIEYCIWHLKTLACLDDAQVSKMSQKELEQGVNNGILSLPNSTTSTDLEKSQKTRDLEPRVKHNW
jgi:hypothetical protein